MKRHAGTRREPLLTKPSLGGTHGVPAVGSSHHRAARGTPAFPKAQVQKPDLSYSQTQPDFAWGDAAAPQLPPSDSQVFPKGKHSCLYAAEAPSCLSFSWSHWGG